MLEQRNLETKSYEGAYLGVALTSRLGTEFVPFEPDLGPEHAARLQSLAQQLIRVRKSAERAKLVRAEFQKTDRRALRLRAALSVLLDLVRHDYVLRIREGRLEVSAVTLSTWKGTPQEYKDFQRRHLLLERHAQLVEPSVVAFIERMEARRSHNGRQASVVDLVADGKAVLKSVLNWDPASDKFPIQAYVQEVAPDAIDEHTGLRLQDIWRYFRHTWTLPYNSTPGRNMQFLIRDAEQLHHPVVGIIGLGSPIIQITARDEHLGWTTKRIRARFLNELPRGNRERREEGARLLAALRRALDQARSGISHKGLIRANRKASSEAAAEIATALQRFSEEEARVTPTRRTGSFADESQTPLYAKKRAKTLLRIVRAQAFFESIENLTTEEQLELLLSTTKGRGALSVAVQEQKKVHVGSSLADLVVCGSVPPYSYLLGGKLVAMLATSPSVIGAYERRYHSAISVIASAMKGAPVVRPSTVVYLGTTSLYETHSSQYERIKIDTPAGPMQYRLLGKTLGFTTVQFSRETREILSSVARKAHGRRRITNTFGEGVNPKLRLVASGMSVIGLDGRLLKYSSRRLVYGVDLASNAREYLLGIASSPRQYWGRAKAEDADALITTQWLARWASKRVQRDDTVKQLEEFDRSMLISSLHAIQRPEKSLDFFG